MVTKANPTPKKEEELVVYLTQDVMYKVLQEWIEWDSNRFI